MNLFNIKKRSELKEKKRFILKEDEYSREREIRKYWTPKLIGWISSTNDAAKLAVTSCLLNSHEWPVWLPSKPDEYDNIRTGVILYFSVDLHRMIKNKSEMLCPGLYDYISKNQYYHNDFDNFLTETTWILTAKK